MKHIFSKPIMVASICVCFPLSINAYAEEYELPIIPEDDSNIETVIITQTENAQPASTEIQMDETTSQKESEHPTYTAVVQPQSRQETELIASSIVSEVSETKVTTSAEIKTSTTTNSENTTVEITTKVAYNTTESGCSTSNADSDSSNDVISVTESKMVSSPVIQDSSNNEHSNSLPIIISLIGSIIIIAVVATFITKKKG